MEPISDVDREEYLSRLGLVLKLARNNAGLTQQEAARMMGGSTVSFTRWEKGETGMSAYDLARLVRIYGLEYDAALVLDPPASRVEIKRRLSPVAKAAAEATRRAVLRPLEGGAGDAGPA